MDRTPRLLRAGSDVRTGQTAISLSSQSTASTGTVTGSVTEPEGQVVVIDADMNLRPAGIAVKLDVRARSAWTQSDGVNW
ncbi:MAG: hypothetical protein WAL41_01205 [Mycobacterium sp.]